MIKYSVINLKTDPELKKRAAKTADKLGISLSAVLNNELRRFATEQSVVFEVPEAPNSQTQKLMKTSAEQVSKGDYHKFETNDEALDFLATQLKWPFSYSKNFIKQSKKLRPSTRAKLLIRIKLFANNPLDPELRDHALKGKYKIYRSIDVTGDYRALYLLRGDEVIFDIVGTHAQLYG